MAFLRFQPAAGSSQATLRHRGLYILALVFFACALLSKSVTATLPAALLLVYWWKLGKIELRRHVLPLLPFFASGAAMGLVTAWIERTMIGARGPEFALSWVERCLIAGRAFWFYLGKLVWPSDLIFIYPRWGVDPSAPSQYLYPAGVLVLAAATWHWRRRFGRGPLAALLFFGGTLSPALGFVNVYPFKFSFVADHFQYLASLGAFAAIAAGSASLLHLAAPRMRRMGAAAGAVCVFGLAFLSWQQSALYLDAHTLWAETARRNPHAFIAFNNLGFEFSRQKRYEEAFRAYRSAIEVKPDFSQAHFNLGRLYGVLGRSVEAVESYRLALAIDPDYAYAGYNLGLELARLGRYAEAVVALQSAVRLDPGLVEARYNLGTLYKKLGRDEEAIVALRSVVEIDPAYAEAWLNLGVAYRGLGRNDEAIEAYRAALSTKPDYIDAHLNLGAVLTAMSRDREAARCFVTAGTLLGQRGRYADAADALLQATLLSPDDADAYFKLGLAYVRQGLTESARDAWKSAVRVDAASAAAEMARHALGEIEESKRPHQRKR